MSDLTVTIWYDHKWHYAFNAAMSWFSKVIMGISTMASSNIMVPTMSDLTLTIWYDHKWFYAINVLMSEYSYILVPTVSDLISAN